jgi:hypothetical protein
VVSRGDGLESICGTGTRAGGTGRLLEQVEAGRTGRRAGGGSRGGQIRLLYEFRQRLRPAGDLSGRAVQSYGRSIPYHPIIDLCAIIAALPTQITRCHHRENPVALHEVGLRPRTLHRICSIAGVKDARGLARLTPEAIKTHTFDTLKQMSLQGSRRRPLIFEVEDLHWIDQTSKPTWRCWWRAWRGRRSCF